MDLPSLLRSMRPQQWIKNVVIFAALIFAHQAMQLSTMSKAVEAFAVFCLLSSSIYLFNDVIDIKRDRWHPIKRNRPIASGKVSPKLAIVTGCIIGGIALTSSHVIGERFFLASATYFILQIAYSLRLKHMVILDVFAIAAGFVLRVIAGAEAILVPVSPWLLSCTMLLALFLGLCKRRHELTSLNEDGIEHRKILTEYSTQLLDQMISIVASATVVCYALYTMSAETVAKFGSTRLIYTVPFALYGIFRYLYLVHKKNSGGSPDTIVLTDVPIIVCLSLYFVTVWLVIYSLR